MPFRINSIALRGASALRLGQITVLVGPNNSGKSRTLCDMRDYVVTGSAKKLTILGAIEADVPATEKEARHNLTILPTASSDIKISGVSNNLLSREEVTVGGAWFNVPYKELKGDGRREMLLKVLGKFWVAHLDAESRFHIAAATETYDMRAESPGNAMQALLHGGKDTLDRFRSAFRETFGTDIALDWATLRRLYLRVAPNFGELPNTRDELDNLMRGAAELGDQGDGYKSFAGVALAMLTFPDRLLLLDEPEAFLHPAQARALGRWIATIARERPGQVVMATHSSDLLWGLVSTDPTTAVIRMNRARTGTTFHPVSAETTREHLNKSVDCCQ